MSAHALGLVFVVACGGGPDPEPERVQRRDEPPVPELVAPPPPPPPPEPLPRGPCRVAGTSGLAPLPLLGPAASFDARGGMLVYRAPDRSVSALAISPEGVLGDAIATGWRTESPMHVARVGERFAVLLQTECSTDEAGCSAIGLLDAAGRRVGEPYLSPSHARGDRWLKPLVHGEALYVFRGREGAPSTLSRFTFASHITEQRLLTIPPSPPEEERGSPYPHALAADGDRWALLVAESGERGRRRLYTSLSDRPVRVVLPLSAQWHGAALRMTFAGDGLQIAGRASAFTASHDTPAWVVALGLDGRPRGPALALSGDDTFDGNTVTATSWRGRFTRFDALRRPIGEALDLPSTARDIIVAGEGRLFFALREQPLGSIVAERIECEPGAPPSPAPRVPFEGDPDPQSPCGPLACSLSAPSLPALLRVVGRECDRLAIGDLRGARDASVDATQVVHRRRTGDETIPETAALRCARGLPEYQGIARWAFLAMRSGAGWTACEVGGGLPSLFDIGVSIAAPETAQWLEGGPPEVTVRVTVADSTSDAGEVDDSTDERLHVCGLDDGEVVCWGSLPASWRRESGSADGELHRQRGRHRIEPDGRGHVTVTRAGSALSRRLDVRRLRPGCRELPTDPEL